MFGLGPATKVYMFRRLLCASASKLLLWSQSCPAWVIFKSVESSDLRPPPGRLESDRPNSDTQLEYGLPGVYERLCLKDRGHDRPS
jgi:hypothetical protein